MKKIILSILCCMALPAFANNWGETNYSTIQECQKAMIGFTIEAINQNNTELVSWFDSFRKDDKITFKQQGVNNMVNFAGGCSAIENKDDQSFGMQRWSTLRYKLMKQIEQLRNRGNSLYSEAAYGCVYPTRSLLKASNCN